MLCTLVLQLVSKNFFIIRFKNKEMIPSCSITKSYYRNIIFLYDHIYWLFCKQTFIILVKSIPAYHWILSKRMTFFWRHQWTSIRIILSLLLENNTTLFTKILWIKNEILQIRTIRNKKIKLCASRFFSKFRSFRRVEEI